MGGPVTAPVPAGHGAHAAPVLSAAGPQDSATCWAIYVRAVRDGAGAHYSTAERRAWIGATAEPPWMAERLAVGRTWLAKRAGVPVGFLTGTGLADVGPAHLDLFFVLPEARGTGVASALYAAFDAAAAGQAMTGYASLFLRPMLERRGWQTVRPDPQERDGQTLMRFVMARAARPRAGS